MLGVTSVLTAAMVRPHGRAGHRLIHGGGTPHQGRPHHSGPMPNPKPPTRTAVQWPATAGVAIASMSAITGRMKALARMVQTLQAILASKTPVPGLTPSRWRSSRNTSVPWRGRRPWGRHPSGRCRNFPTSPTLVRPARSRLESHTPCVVEVQRLRLPPPHPRVRAAQRPEGLRELVVRPDRDLPRVAPTRSPLALPCLVGGHQEVGAQRRGHLVRAAIHETGPRRRPSAITSAPRGARRAPVRGDRGWNSTGEVTKSTSGACCSSALSMRVRSAGSSGRSERSGNRQNSGSGRPRASAAALASISRSLASPWAPPSVTTTTCASTTAAGRRARAWRRSRKAFIVRDEARAPASGCPEGNPAAYGISSLSTRSRPNLFIAASAAERTPSIRHPQSPENRQRCTRGTRSGGAYSHLTSMHPVGHHDPHRY